MLVECIDRHPSLPTFSRLLCRNSIEQRLCNRLRIEAAIAADPTITEQPVERPVFIVGPARSGTTLLHRLLAVDPTNRTLRQWEMDHPVPPPRAESFRADPRVKQVERENARLSRLVPGVKRIHEVGANKPEECVFLFAHDFSSIGLISKLSARPWPSLICGCRGWRSTRKPTIDYGPSWLPVSARLSKTSSE